MKIHADFCSIYYTWYKNNILHREGYLSGDLPSIEWSNGDKEWYKEGNLHREGDLPAIDHGDNYKEWYKEGKLHREGGLPAIEFTSGLKLWCYNGAFLNASSNEEALRLIKLKCFW